MFEEIIDGQISKPHLTLSLSYAIWCNSYNNQKNCVDKIYRRNFPTNLNYSMFFHVSERIEFAINFKWILIGCSGEFLEKFLEELLH